MTALFAIITFFFIFVLVYTAITAALTAAAWWAERRTRSRDDTVKTQQIGEKVDRLKEKVFLVSMIITFFFVTPFVVIYLFVLPA